MPIPMLVSIDEFRVGADRCVRPRVSHRICSSKPLKIPALTGVPTCPYKSIYLASIAATADTNADERSATGQCEGERARLRRDVGAGI